MTLRGIPMNLLPLLPLTLQLACGKALELARGKA